MSNSSPLSNNHSFVDLIEFLREKMGSDSAISTAFQQQCHSFLMQVLGVLVYLEKQGKIEKQDLQQIYQQIYQLLDSSEVGAGLSEQEKHPRSEPRNFSSAKELYAKEPLINSDNPTEFIKAKCWEIVHCDHESQLDKLLHDQQAFCKKHFDLQIPTAPSKDDLIIYGGAFSRTEPIWIAPPLKDWLKNDDNRLRKNALDKHIWLSSATKWQAPLSHQDTSTIMRPEFQSLLATWENFMIWVFMIPQGLFIFKNQIHPISNISAELSNDLYDTSLRLKNELSKNSLGDNFITELHIIYAKVTGHLLLPNCLSKRFNPPRLLQDFKKRMDSIVKDLPGVSIQQGFTTGRPNNSMMFTATSRFAMNPIPIKPDSELALQLGVDSHREGEVLYWYQPYWHDEQDRMKGRFIYLYN